MYRTFSSTVRTPGQSSPAAGAVGCQLRGLSRKDRSQLGCSRASPGAVQQLGWSPSEALLEQR